MFRSFFTKETIIISLAMTMITIISIGVFFAPLLRYRCLGDNKRYTKDLYYTWHNIYVNELCELVMFSEPSLANWSVTAIYKYGNDNLDVKQKYIKLLQDNDWKLERVESSKQIFSKNNLLYKSRSSMLLGLVVMALFKPRTWCTFCPMGTMTQMICKMKK